MRKNIHIVLPFIFISFIFMIWDIGGIKGFISPMEEWVSGFFHHLFPVMATYTLFVIGRHYIVALWRFLRTGVANMETLIGLGTLTGFIYSFIVTAFE